MTKKKGIAVVSGSGAIAFKFLDDGTSVLGKDENSIHSFTGSLDVSGAMDIQGNLVMNQRVGGYKFGLPYLDANTDAAALNQLDTNAEDYNGFMFYLTGSLATDPFLHANKIYFCEDGVWHASPFFKEDEE